MGFEQLRRYDQQARWSAWLAGGSILPFLAGAYLILSRYESVLGRIVYGAGGNFVAAFAVTVLVSLAIAAAGAMLGLSSAGQRRNDKSALSWFGFLLGGLIATLDLVLLLAFAMLRLQTV